MSDGGSRRAGRGLALIVLSVLLAVLAGLGYPIGSWAQPPLPGIAGGTASILPQEPEAASPTQPGVLKAEVERLRVDAAAATASAAKYKQSIEAVPQLLEKLRAELAQPIPEPERIDRRRISTTDLAGQYQAAKAQLETERRARSALDEDAAARAQRRPGALAETERHRSRLFEVEQSLAASPDPAEEPVLAKAKAERLHAEREFLEAKIGELEIELRAYDAQGELLRTRKQVADRRILIAERNVAAIRDVLVEFRAAELEASLRRAEARAVAAASGHPAVLAVAQENVALARELVGLVRTLEEAASASLDITSQVWAITKSFDSARERVARVGLTETAGLHFRTLRAQLPDERQLRRRLELRAEEIARVQLRRLVLEDMQGALIDPQTVAKQRLATFPSLNEADSKAVLAQLQDELRQQRTTYLASLLQGYDNYTSDVLMPQDEAQRQLLSVAHRFREFLDERILWVKSSPPLSLGEVAAAWEAVFWLTDPDMWAKLLADLWEDFTIHIALYSSALLMFLGLMSARLRLYAQMRRLNELAGYRLRARIEHTALVAIGTLIVALPWPWLAWFLGWRLDAHEDAAFSHAVGAGLQWVAVLLLAANVLLGLLRPAGLVQAHFGFDPAVCTLVRRATRWALPLALPLAFLVSVTDAQHVDHYRSLGRFAFLGAMVVALIYIYWVFKPDKGVLRSTMAAHPDGWLARLRYVWFGLALLVPVGFSIAAALGYYYTAMQLERQVVHTALLVLSLVLTREFLVRWVNLTQVKMAMDQARAQLMAARKASGGEVGVGAAPGEPPLEETNIDVAAISAQVLTLLNGLLVMGVLAGVLWVWRDVLPAFQALRGVELWTDLVTTAVGEGGAEAMKAVQQVVPVTLGDLLVGLFALIVTIIVSKNIPGLLEIAVLQHLPITPGGRYAVTTLVRYVIVIVGVLIAFASVGVSWSKVQWLAAAITVGLGFGLQEIFANFVSGLIMLFERPVRVGDVVTLGNVSGTVTRISMRATTVLDWDRKEHLIPNKQFVTGEVINWSLTDSILRIPMQIGVAYGTDTELATDLLLKIAHAHPKVLKEPPPRAFFRAFGESSLDFALYAFVATPDDRLPVQHELLSQVAKTFATHGIEIAFPQRDLHLRSVSAEILEGLRGAGGAAAPA